MCSIPHLTKLYSLEGVVLPEIPTAGVQSLQIINLKNLKEHGKFDDKARITVNFAQ